MDRKEDREILRKGGFSESEVKQLSQLRKLHIERERLRQLEDNRRLEFVRWLYHNRKLTDQVAS